jgi:hypothetical protein
VRTRASHKPPAPADPAPVFKVFSLAEEIAHAVSHGIGIILSIAALTVLVAVSFRDGGVRHVVASAVFGTTLILLYAASTLYHSITDPRIKPLQQSGFPADRLFSKGRGHRRRGAVEESGLLVFFFRQHSQILQAGVPMGFLERTVYSAG